MQGTQNNNGVEAGGVVDLDALLAARLLQPATVKIGGRNWQIRTDLTGVEVLRCLAFIRSGEIQGAFTYLLGTRKDIAQLNAAMAEREQAEKAAHVSGGRVTYSDLPYGQRAQEMYDLLVAMPRMHSALVQAHIFRTSKALAEFALDDDTIHRTYDYTPGESSAS